jgi:sulfur carrier protein ThiS
MSVKVIFRKNTVELPSGLTVRQVLSQLGLNPESHLVVCEGELLTEDTMLRDEKVVKIVAVISGGSS